MDLFCRLEPNPTRLTVYHSKGHKPLAIDTVEVTDASSREEVHLGTSQLHTDNYVVNIGLGTPPREMTVVMDTGSSITWVQCAPCPPNNCHHQRDVLFDPAMSSTYQTFDCLSSQCMLLIYPICSDDDGSCSYETEYMDNSYSSGQFVSDSLTLNAVDTIENFLFGCGHDQNSYLFGQTSGLLGLGPPTNALSLLGQDAGTFLGTSFAYCLPQGSSAGYLEFGAGAADEGSSFATLTSIDGGYFVDLLAVEVNGVERRISTTMMVDTGTVLSRLPAELYAEIKTLVEEAAGEALVPGPRQGYFSDCYDTVAANGKKEVPLINVTLKLGGGAQLELDDASVFLTDASSNSRCLAFVSNADSEDSVLGNMHQTTNRWSFDILNSMVAITPNAC